MLIRTVRPLAYLFRTVLRVSAIAFAVAEGRQKAHRHASPIPQEWDRGIVRNEAQIFPTNEGDAPHTLPATAADPLPRKAAMLPSRLHGRTGSSFAVPIPIASEIFLTSPFARAALVMDKQHTLADDRSYHLGQTPIELSLRREPAQYRREDSRAMFPVHLLRLPAHSWWSFLNRH